MQICLIRDEELRCGFAQYLVYNFPKLKRKLHSIILGLNLAPCYYYDYYCFMILVLLTVGAYSFSLYSLYYFTGPVFICLHLSTIGIKYYNFVVPFGVVEAEGFEPTPSKGLVAKKHNEVVVFNSYRT